jgi:hypothetical protein
MTVVYPALFHGEDGDDTRYQINDADRITTAKDPYLLRDDPIRDEVAIELASRGIRKVRLTAAERAICALIIRHDYHELCADYDEEPDGAAVIDLVHDYLVMPSREAAAALVASLPNGSKAAELVRYWKSPAYREAKREQDRIRYARRKAVRQEELEAA